MEEKKESFKILMFPWLAHGHIFPYLELAKRLSATHHFTMYLCSTTVNLDSIKSSISSEDDAAASVKLIELHMPSPPQLPPHLHTTSNLPSHLLLTLMKTFQESSSSFSDILDSLKPDLVIFDVYQPWAPKITSSKVGSGATFPFPAISLPDDDLTRRLALLAQNLRDADDDFAYGAMARSTGIVLSKSSRHVEQKYADYLSALSKKKIVCTGPLIAADANEHDDFEIMKWLNGKNLDSTIYISFGSECFLSKKQIEEIAKGLDLCDASFLWVIRFPAEEEAGTSIRLVEEELPAGFIETTKERGLVVTRWAPQTKILGHPSIGGFVSHCGRSSITESMYFGVPVIAMPMNADQPMNAQLMVELGVGVEVEKDHENGVYVGEEVAKAINKVIEEKNVLYEGLRSRARRLSETLREKEDEEVNEVAQQVSSY
ncbi:UDP-glucosyltransferase 29-like isoform X2 [Salvia hispanica]|uniref:UDP-glucosyltransferase 29-like isoform X2 n=1 Tax=Salvia hispanica TaxID=49212 RepID=UPI002009BBAF|nr:UDP-glucosyltransferase 29-like isoform X2 [Salvia hispanica]